MFRLSKLEFSNLRSQIVTSNHMDSISHIKRGGRRYLPYAYTDHGVTSLSGILKSDKAIQINILIIKAFVSMKKLFPQMHRFFKD